VRTTEAQVEVKSTYIRSFKDNGETYYLRMRGYCKNVWNGWNRGIYPIENQGEVVSTGPMREGETREVEVEEIDDSGGSTCGTTGDVDHGGLVVVPVLFDQHPVEQRPSALALNDGYPGPRTDDRLTREIEITENNNWGTDLEKSDETSSDQSTVTKNNEDIDEQRDDTEEETGKDENSNFDNFRYSHTVRRIINRYR